MSVGLGAVAVELSAVLCLLAVTAACAVVSRRCGDGGGGAAVRITATLIAPALVLGFAGLFWWPAAMATSLAAALVQFVRARDRRAEPLAWRPSWVVLPAALLLLSLALKAAVEVASPPYDNDSLVYHLPMAVAYLQEHGARGIPMLFHPGNAELLDALGLGAQGGIGGQAAMDAIAVLVLLLGTYGVVRACGRSREDAALCAVAAGCIPIAVDQAFTAQNDILVAGLMLAFVATWWRRPALCALAFGLVAGVKFTGAVYALPVAALLWWWRPARFRPLHVVLAAAFALPWYVRNALLTGNPFFLGRVTEGFASTIVAHINVTYKPSITAVRNYGGLVAFLGVFALPVLGRRTVGARPLEIVLAPMAALTFVAWLFTPNGAETVPGTLDQILPGWSIRYILFTLVLLTIGAVLYLQRVDRRLALAAVTVFALAAANRSFGAMHRFDADALGFALPLLAAGVVLACAVVVRLPALRVSGAVLAAALFAFTSSAGSERIAQVWTARFAAGAHPIGILATSDVQSASRVATLIVYPLPLIGPRFERYAIGDFAGLTPAAWWRTVEEVRPQLIVAADGDPDAEQLVREHGYVRVYRDSYLRMYRLRGSN